MPYGKPGDSQAVILTGRPTRTGSGIRRERFRSPQPHNTGSPRGANRFLWFDRKMNQSVGTWNWSHRYSRKS
jgi:hypothetical protein